MRRRPTGWRDSDADTSPNRVFADSYPRAKPAIGAREAARVDPHLRLLRSSLSPCETVAPLTSVSPQELVGYYALTDGEVVEGRVFEHVGTGVAVIANNVTVRPCLMRRLITDGGCG